MNAKNFHMYAWSVKPCYIAVAQARSVAEARRLVLAEIGTPTDGTCPERERAYNDVLTTTPTIWRYSNAEFALTDSAELREMDANCEEKRKYIAALEAKVRELEAKVAQASATGKEQ